MPQVTFVCKSCGKIKTYDYGGRGPKRKYCCAACKPYCCANTKRFLKRVSEQATAWRAEGRCITCGEPAEPGRLRCEKHLEHHREFKRRLRREKRADGICLYSSCTKLAVKCGYCITHYLSDCS